MNDEIINEAIRIIKDCLQATPVVDYENIKRQAHIILKALKDVKLTGR